MILPGLPDNEEERLASLYLIDLIGKNGIARFDRLTRLARQLFDVPIAVLSLLDKDRQWILSAAGTDIEETPRTVSFCAHAILKEGVFVIRDTLQDPRFCENPFVKNEPHLRFYAGCPVRLPDGMIAGIICVVDTAPRFFSSDEVNAMLDLAAIVEDEFESISLVMTDGTTGLLNRRGFLQRGERQIQQLAKKDSPYVVITFHVLNIVSISDLLGTGESEAAIRKFSAILALTAGSQAISTHVGGGCFHVLVEKTDDFTADKFLFDLQNEVDIYNKNTAKLYNLNYSYGMADSEDDGYCSLHDMIDRSDKVTYSENIRHHS